MTDSVASDATTTEKDKAPVALERLLRLWSGLALFTFVLFHLLNHALGIFGLDVMHAGQKLRWLVFGSAPAIMLLYLAAVVHVTLTLRRVLARQTWRMPVAEAAQILFGLMIPLLLAGHLVGTRIAQNAFGADQTYGTLLPNLWNGHALTQTALVIAVWVHGCIGVHYVLRHRRFYARIRTAALIAAVLVPTLALAGFAAGSREASLSPPPPLTADETATLQQARATMYAAVAALAALGLGFLGVGALRRRAARQLVIAYRGRGPVRVPRGMSVLEASRIHGIPHPSVCGGRGRCATCRVHVLSSLHKLPEPNVVEKALLNAIAAPADVRIACQLRPTDNITVRILLPVLGRASTDLTEEESREWAVEQDATVMVVDLRGFNALTRTQQPYEIAVLVNRFRSEMIEAVRHHDGHVATFYGDGLVAFFGEAEDRYAGSRQALAAAGDVARVLDGIDREMGSALSVPVRAGIGLHTGPTILARVGDDARTAVPMALGMTVNIAQTLEDATKDVVADCLVSESTATMSGYDFAGLPLKTIQMPGADQSIKAFALADCQTLHTLLRGAARRTVAPKSAAEETA